MSLIPLSVIKPTIKLILSVIKNAEEIFGEGEGKEKKKHVLEQVAKNGYDVVDVIAAEFVEGGLPDEVDGYVRDHLLGDIIDTGVDFFNMNESFTEGLFEKAADFIGLELPNLDGEQNETN